MGRVLELGAVKLDVRIQVHKVVSVLVVNLESALVISLVFFAQEPRSVDTTVIEVIDVEIVVDESPDGGEARRARLTPAGAWEGRGLEFRS